jgi:hypothetical protein
MPAGTGAAGNLHCACYFFLPKDMLYPGSRFQMAGDLLETYLRRMIEAHAHALEPVQAAWVPVHKQISRFSLAGGQIQAPVLGAGEEPGCMVELTEVHWHGEAWWTLGFEATGPAALLGHELEVTATLVLAQPLPDGIELDTARSQSYAEWLGRQPGAGTPPPGLNSLSCGDQ